MYICDFSRSVGRQATTLKTGADRSVIRLMVPPLPRIPALEDEQILAVAFTHSCIATSSP